LLKIALFSASVLTGPRNVTLPFALTIFTLCAIIESESSFVTARRILRVSSKSLLAFDCWPAVIAAGARSLTLIPELSGAVGVGT
jgi:hypothetical protein